jgi:hypothetical protein
MHISEPVTMLTDYALGLLNLFFAISTYNGMHARNRVSGLLLLLGFAFQAISGFSAGRFMALPITFRLPDGSRYGI